MRRTMLAMNRLTTALRLAFALPVFALLAPVAVAQSAGTLPLTNQPGTSPRLSPLTMPAISPGLVELMDLEARFAADTAKGGGKAFSTWFAEDGVTLNNGQPAVLGQRAIAANAQWDPKTYQLTWQPQGGQLGPSGDTGFTWGHYQGKGTDRKGQPIALSGRYITFWKKVNGTWKVALDASADDVPGSGDCCTVPKP